MWKKTQKRESYKILQSCEVSFTNFSKELKMKVQWPRFATWPRKNCIAAFVAEKAGLVLGFRHILMNFDETWKNVEFLQKNSFKSRNSRNPFHLTEILIWTKTFRNFFRLYYENETGFQCLLKLNFRRYLGCCTVFLGVQIRKTKRKDYKPGS